MIQKIFYFSSFLTFNIEFKCNTKYFLSLIHLSQSLFSFCCGSFVCFISVMLFFFLEGLVLVVARIVNQIPVASWAITLFFASQFSFHPFTALYKSSFLKVFLRHHRNCHASSNKNFESFLLQYFYVLSVFLFSR